MIGSWFQSTCDEISLHSEEVGAENPMASFLGKLKNSTLPNGEVIDGASLWSRTYLSIKTMLVEKPDETTETTPTVEEVEESKDAEEKGAE